MSRLLQCRHRAGTSARSATSRRGRSFTSHNRFINVSDEVRDALQHRKPVVALETTIYTHGFPYPENVALASHLESLVRTNGGVPATIGVLNGVARVGFHPEELIELVSAAGRPETMKISRRDLGFVAGLGAMGTKLNGGTTVAATMMLAHRVGINVFATGGLGGVHQGGEKSFDISADLTELGRTPVAVVSAGCKSFLDLPRTLEYLETQGVGIATFADGRAGPVDLPGFYVRDSGIKSPRTIKDEVEAAAILHAQLSIPVNSGIWFAGPVPAIDSLTKEEVDEWVVMALQETEKKNIHGAANTPYVLERIKQLSHGRSVLANKAAISANVVRATKLTTELRKLELHEPEQSVRGCQPARAADPQIKLDEQDRGLRAGSSSSLSQAQYQMIVVGGLAADLTCDYAPLDCFNEKVFPALHTSNPATISHNVGGVGHNIALAAHYAGASTLLLSAVGDDPTGHTVLKQAQENGLPTINILRPDRPVVAARTAQYVAMNDGNKDLVMAMADMSIFSSPLLNSAHIWRETITKHRPSWVVLDSNWSEEIIERIIAAARLVPARIALDPVSVQKSSRLIRILNDRTVSPNHIIDLVAPNALELQNMHRIATEKLLFEGESWSQMIDALQLSSSESRDRLAQMTSVELVDRGIPQKGLQLLPYLSCIVTKLGAQGSLLTQLLSPTDSRLHDPDVAQHILARTDAKNVATAHVGGVYMRLFPPTEVVPKEDVVSVNGVGDTLLGVLVAGLSKHGTGDGDNDASSAYRPERVEDLLMLAQNASIRSLKDTRSVSASIPRYF